MGRKKKKAILDYILWKEYYKSKPALTNEFITQNAFTEWSKRNKSKRKNKLRRWVLNWRLRWSKRGK